METMTKNEIKEILEKEDLKILKSLGQNFLIDKNIINKLIEEVRNNETIVEVGPGFGSLTSPLIEKSKKVIAIEKDKKIAEILKTKFSLEKKIEVVTGDVLKSAKILPKTDYIVVANIPFYITSRLIRFFLENERKPKEIIVLLQKEVAKRICEKPPKMNLLALSVQLYSEPQILFNVSRNSFWPAPKVDCSVIKIKINKQAPACPDLFFKITKAGFSKPRAQLLNNLSKQLRLNKSDVLCWLKNSGVNPTQRAETLSLNDWIKLVKNNGN